MTRSKVERSPRASIEKSLGRRHMSVGKISDMNIISNRCAVWRFIISACLAPLGCTTLQGFL